jgi:hypothetical protein
MAETYGVPDGTTGILIGGPLDRSAGNLVSAIIRHELGRLDCNVIATAIRYLWIDPDANGNYPIEACEETKQIINDMGIAKSRTELDLGYGRELEIAERALGFYVDANRPRAWRIGQRIKRQRAEKMLSHFEDKIPFFVRYQTPVTQD